MWFNAVYYIFVCIIVYNIFAQEHLYTVLFYFLQVIPKATIALFSLVNSEIKHGLIKQISHKLRHPVIFTFILKYAFPSPNFKLLLHKRN